MNDIIKKEDEKNRFIDTLIIVTGFIIAGSYNSDNTLYLYMLFGFLLFAILTKSQLLNLKNDAFVINSAYFIMSLCFPLIFMAFFLRMVLLMAFIAS